ncbi:cation:proton antiporter [Lactobacillus crispatus]|uniref:Na-H antiporter n=1 Tax=Lactobacillus crispatus (strain ST1) TaxID=748671 RepID=D5H3B3_LACCS|nr:cation:proton antiporter [Lactobacillus crispatus]MBI1703792.1 Na-H antiporter [Lactobacillus crispatus]CBL50498.1 Na-H antiporter [Lactobacillus crispatus ST1]
MPTDATATESVTHGLKLPKKIAFYLKDESLFNDASGIILLNMAVDWYLHQELRIGQAIGNFLYSAGGGIFLGALVATLLVFLRQESFRSKYHLSAGVAMPVDVIFFLTPLIIYFLAEEIHVSGIIAVVAAGLIHNVESERSRLTNAFIFYNGIILYLANLLIRYFYYRFSPSIKGKTSNKEALVFSLGGIHGAVTFALAYTLYDLRINVADFHLILVSEMTLILLSMIVPTIVFHMILDKDIPDFDQRKEVDRVRVAMIEYAMDQMKKIYLPKKIRKQLEFDLRAQMNQTSMVDFAREIKYTIKQKELPDDQKEFRAEVYRYAFRQERDYLGKIAQQERISSRLSGFI